MAKLKGKRVLVTGAAHGIGRRLCECLAKDGCTLVITDLDAGALSTAASELSAHGVSVHTYPMDVSDRAAVEKMAADVGVRLGGLDILVNNAGIGHNGEIVETSIEKWEQLMAVNFWGPMYHVYAFLPMMVRQGSGHIVNVSSGQAFYRVPTWGPYATIKCALGAFSELLALELKKFDVKVTTVYPYMVSTGFYKEVKGETLGTRLSMKLLPFYSQSPRKVARIIHKAIRKQKSVEMVSLINNLGYFSRLLPPLSNLMSNMSLLFLGKDADVLRREAGMFQDN
ncbi:MAG: SDR family NAD(P)-dependent oxidoreductase [Desulfatibacillaceae bacterium]